MVKKKKTTAKKIDPDQPGLAGSMIILHGQPGVGKTQLFANFPGPHKWFATERGHKFIPADQQENLTSLPPEAGSWTKFIEATRDLKTYRTVVVDTAGGLFDICMQHVCEKNNWKHPSDGSHGKGWSALKTEFYRGMNKLVFACNKQAVLGMICHSKEVEVETATMKTTKVVCNLTGTAQSVLMPIPDYIWFMGYADSGGEGSLADLDGKRTLFMDGSTGVQAKCRDPRITRRYLTPLSKTEPYRHILKAIRT